LSASLLFVSNIGCYSKQPQNTKGDNPGFAVVELFTFEGCSSCPAAEAALAEIHNEFRQNVYVMEFHVDYWNSPGWKDTYSSTARQQHYVQSMHLNLAYTPQAIVNGKDELVGSDRQKLHSLITDNLRKKTVKQYQVNGRKKW